MNEKSAVIATGVTREGFVSPDGFNGGESISVVSEGGVLSAFISSVSPSYGSSVGMDDFFVTRVKKNGEWEEVDNILASKFFAPNKGKTELSFKAFNSLEYGQIQGWLYTFTDCDEYELNNVLGITLPVVHEVDAPSEFNEYGIEHEISLTRNIGGTWSGWAHYEFGRGLRHEIVNLTPHALNLKKWDGQVIEIAPSGQLARVDQVRQARSNIRGLEVTLSEYGEITGLPEPTPHKIFVVSALVLAHPSVQNRIDVFCPGEAVRDEAGKIIGAKGLSCTPAYKY